MAMTRFGFWPRPWRIELPELQVEPLSDYVERVEAIHSSNRSFEGWIYPPLQRVLLSGRQGPEVPTKAYGLPSTHELKVSANDAHLPAFVVALIGLFDGMRLVPEGWSHFYKAPIEPTKLVDFHCSQSEMTKVLDLSLYWWRRTNEERQTRMFGAIHWYCFSAAYEHDFERFGGLYTVLDSLYSIHELQNGGTLNLRHSERADALAKAYGIPVPSWAAVEGRSCTLSRLRNEFIHEGLYGGEPIGFAFPKGEITLELAAFVARVIVGMLGIECEYVHSPVTTRQMHGLDLLDARRPRRG
jgi:hypothetical protein